MTRNRDDLLQDDYRDMLMYPEDRPDDPTGPSVDEEPGDEAEECAADY